MRSLNSFAAAVAAAVTAVVVSLAMQPAEAAYVTIDNFTVNDGNTVSSSDTAGGELLWASEVPTPPQSIQAAGLWGQRLTDMGYYQQGGFGGRTNATFTALQSLGTWSWTKSAVGTGRNQTEFVTNILWTGTDGTTRDLVGDGSGTGPNYQISLDIASSSYTFPVSDSYLFFGDINGKTAAKFFPGGPSAGNQLIDFTAFTTDGLDWTKVTEMGFTVRSGRTTTDGVANAGFAQQTITFNNISAVPEPSQMVLVAGAGAVLGAWRLRRLRRGRPADGEALAC